MYIYIYIENDIENNRLFQKWCRAACESKHVLFLVALSGIKPSAIDWKYNYCFC